MLGKCRQASEFVAWPAHWHGDLDYSMGKLIPVFSVDVVRFSTMNCRVLLFQNPSPRGVIQREDCNISCSSLRGT